MSTRLRPDKWKSLAPPPLPGPAFAAQSSLPRLPVPPLIDTISRLKEALRPIATDDEEYSEAIRKIDSFASGPAEELQRRLQARHAETTHWLEDWWDDGGYLAYRDPVSNTSGIQWPVITPRSFRSYVIPTIDGFDDHPAHLPQTPAHRAASIVRAAMLFRQKLKLGQLEPEATKEGPICMDTYRWMFDCCRVPGQPADWSVTYSNAGDRGDSGHVVVLRRGRAWKLEPWQEGSLLSVSELLKQIEYIYAHTAEEYPAVGLLTAGDRDAWTKDYDALAAHPQNKEVLHTIHSAAFVLCLDTEHAPDLVSHSRLLWHGAISSSSPAEMGLRNRWMDKPVQFVVMDDGKAGLVGEHSVMDGTPTVNLCDHVLDTIAAPGFSETETMSSISVHPSPLDWFISPDTEIAITRSASAAHALASSQALNIVRTRYGKREIKAFGVSPDSWAQLLVQFAYARLLRARGERRMGGTYEAASTRRFFKGRTEAIRVVSTEADAWVQAMDDPVVSMKVRRELFAAAAGVHIMRARMAGKGLGVDRHLLGLKKVLKEGEAMHEMFSDPVVTRSSYWVLSTSAVFSKHFGPYGWGEVVPDGFGVAYMTGFDDYLQFTITSRTEMPNEQFCAEIERAAEDLYKLHSTLGKEQQGFSTAPPNSRL
ncbi:uncharacterized protein FIBRA_03405 [Fibroporia radiculosa]|uniref:Choline/carnitine acyltransferase domain-containing protein n=1 Tax=Fibroporia radiculosa TaxID=599839 RepID=J4GNG6_9APHY|nr:uncharacterized protein FIBRA_03405 [Fibroporia radiculosa]CCM01355.1 predicted protein [Fibroporia radiculosa]